MIRRLLPSDILAITEIEGSIQCYPWTEGMFQGSEGFVLINEVEGMPRAYLIIQHVLDECHILNVGVRQEYQRRGYATQLFQYLLQVLPATCQRILLEVARSNLAAIQFYEKFQFQLIAIRKNYYANQEDALIYERVLRLQKTL